MIDIVLLHATAWFSSVRHNQDPLWDDGRGE